ncbi:MAG: ABC transporter ATP-binding protein [Bacteroidales bacterium]|nr:ABC transporter ATP-binding protein [Bacteroidales bacterium]
MIEVKNIYKSYGNLHVLQDISFEIKQGEIVAVTGASGAGKTTLLNIIGTLDKADKGQVIINNRNITTLKDKELSLFRNKEIGFVFQFHYLLNEFTALENTVMPAVLYKGNKKEATQKAMELLDLLSVADKCNNFPSELSGGEQQRIAIARALINSPSIVLADEPSGNLDSKNSQALFDLFFLLREKFNQTFVIVTHSELFADKSDRKLIISDGKITE